MNKTNWSVKSWNVEDFLFTYSEEEKQYNEINRSNAKLLFTPKFIPFYPTLSEIWLDNTETLLYWFIDFYLSNGKTDRFYFTNEQLSNILNVSERKITDSIKKLKDIWLIYPKYKIRNEWWKIRFINNKDFVPIDEITRKKEHFRLAKNNTLDSQDLLEIDNKINNNKIYKNKNKLHQTKFDDVLSFFWLSLSIVEEWFSYSKSSKHIIDCLSFIKECSAKLDILPVYNKDTINSTSILINKWYSVDKIVQIAKDDWRSDGCQTYQEMIRNDYYLPSMY